MINRSNIREGMTVYSSDGEKLGKVQSCDASMFVIEKGFFFPKDYIARYDDVSTVDGDDIRLSLSKDSFQRTRESGKEDEGWRAGSVETTNRPPPTDADVLATDYGLDRTGSPTGATGGAWRGGSSGTMRTAGDQVSRSARSEATGEDIRVPIAEEELDVVKRVDVEGEDRTPRSNRTDEDLGTTRRMGDEDTSGTTRRMSDADDPFFGMPPRDDT